MIEIQRKEQLNVNAKKPLAMLRTTSFVAQTRFQI